MLGAGDIVHGVGDGAAARTLGGRADGAEPVRRSVTVTAPPPRRDRRTVDASACSAPRRARCASTSRSAGTPRFRIGGPADVFIEVASVPELADPSLRMRRARAAAGLLARRRHQPAGERSRRARHRREARASPSTSSSGSSPRTAPRACASGPRCRSSGSCSQTVAGAARRARVRRGHSGHGRRRTADERRRLRRRDRPTWSTALEVVDRPRRAAASCRATGSRFAYRRLDLPRGAVVTARASCALAARRAGGARARAIADAKARRDRHQPLGHPNAGSIFKNPPGDFAGRLIEAVGLKGAPARQRAWSPPQHANFIVNLGGARAADVKGLMDLATARRCGSDSASSSSPRCGWWGTGEGGRWTWCGTISRRGRRCCSGGLSAEREISVQSGAAVATALRELRLSGHAPCRSGATSRARLARLRPRRAFNALHGRYGEDGASRACSR